MAKRRILQVERFEDRLNPGAIPVLNSYAAAPADIYLDFDGNTSPVVTPYDTDGNDADYSTSEQTDITNAWIQLSAYFAMFNVNVTTVYTAARPKAWLGLGNNISGGYSYVNVFPNTKTESFNQSSDVRNRNSGLTHEVGHNFGLSHQSAFNSLGVQTADYISAVEPLRGYLMGVDYSGTVKKWSIGHTSNASGLQDDVAIIAGDLDNYGGDGFRPDDFAGTIAAATPLLVNGAFQTQTGIIERLTDVDTFSFSSLGGRMSFTVEPNETSGLDAVLEIRDASNNLLAVADTENNGQTLTATLPAGTFYAFVKSKENYADLGQYNLIVSEGVPAEYQTKNIGLQWHTGRTRYDSSNGTWYITGSGNDIWNSSDQFQYAYRLMSGDGTLTVRVTGLENTNGNAKAGVMIRDSLAANSRHASTFVQRSFLPQSVSRTTTGGSSSSAGGGSASFAPYWVRLTKSGTSFTSQYSSNGTTWTTINTRTVTVGTNFYIGLAVTSHEEEETNTTDDLNDAVLTNFSFTGFTDPLAVTNAGLAAPANVVAALGTANGVNLTWDTAAAATGYSIERSADNSTFAPIGTSTTASYTDANPTGSQRWWYRVRSTNATGRSDVSGAVMIVNRPSPIRSLEFTSYTTTSIVLDWLDTDGETGVRIERSTDNATWTTLSTVGRNIPSYTATGLTASTQYYFRVTPTSSLGDGTSLTVNGFTRLAAVTAVSFGNIASTSVQINWTDVANATTYRIERSTDDGTTWASAGTVAAGVQTFTNTGLTAETEYQYRVIGLNASTESTSGSTVLRVGTPPVTAIASPWLSADIGTPATTRGMSSFNAGTFKVISGGSDIWGTSDQFRFTYQQLVGNGVITAKVESTEDTGGWAKIGVMVRETLNANSRHAHVNVTPGQGVSLQSRTSTGGSSTNNVQTTGLTAPYWVRMMRKGNVLTASSSPDGVTWTQVGTVTLSNLAQTVFIGLSANANTSTLLNTSTYSNVSVLRTGVQGVAVDNGTTQRSAVRSLTVTFNGLVTLPTNPAAAFTVARTGGGSPTFTVSTAGSTATQTVAKLTFSTPLADGNYTLTVLAAQVTDASPFALGLMPANVTNNFHRLFGDSNGDRTIDATDMSAFGAAFGSTGSNTVFDFNFDSIVDATDMAQFGNRFGITI